MSKLVENFVELYSGDGGSWYFVKIDHPHQERLRRPNGVSRHGSLRNADNIGNMVGTIDRKDGCYTLKITGFHTEPQKFETKRDAEIVLSAHIALTAA